MGGYDVGGHVVGGYKSVHERTIMQGGGTILRGTRGLYVHEREHVYTTQLFVAYF